MKLVLCERLALVEKNMQEKVSLEYTLAIYR